MGIDVVLIGDRLRKDAVVVVRRRGAPVEGVPRLVAGVTKARRVKRVPVRVVRGRPDDRSRIGDFHEPVLLVPRVLGEVSVRIGPRAHVAGRVVRV